MKKITQIAFSVLFLLFSFNPIKLMSAQYVFKTDALHSDSVALYSFATKPDKYGTLVFNKLEGYLPNGTLVTINGVKELARIAVSQGCGRLEWCCLDWNQPSIDFYLSLGARPMDDWKQYRLTGETLKKLAK